jgi:antitoxin ParD1/3/4
MAAMTICLPRELELLVEKKLKSGLYPTAREVIREGLRLLDERDRLYDTRRADLQKEIRKGFASGHVTAFNPESLKKKVRTGKHR